MRRRSNVLLLIGLAFFVVGAAVVFVALRDDDDSGGVSGPDKVEVVVAKESLVAGTLGDDVIAGDQFEMVEVPLSARQADAITTPSQLSNQILTLSFADGEQLRSGGLRPRSLLSQQVDVPDGKEAVAVTTSFVGGGAGYVSPGDLVNVFAVVAPAPEGATVILEDGTAQQVPLPYTTPRAELLLTNVTVLDVNQEIEPLRGQAVSADPNAVNQTARPSGTALTVLLAVDTVDAEKIVLQTTSAGSSIYLSRVNDDAPPAGPTAGQDPFTVLLEEAVDAFARSQTAP